MDSDPPHECCLKGACLAVLDREGTKYAVRRSGVVWCGRATLPDVPHGAHVILRRVLGDAVDKESSLIEHALYFGRSRKGNRSQRVSS